MLIDKFMIKDTQSIEKNMVASIVGVSVSILFLLVMTVVSELVPELKVWLTNSFSHHWVGKGVLSIAVFLVFFGLDRTYKTKITEKGLVGAVNTLNILVIFSAVLILLFFIYEGLHS